MRQFQLFYIGKAQSRHNGGFFLNTDIKNLANINLFHGILQKEIEEMLLCCHGMFQHFSRQEFIFHAEDIPRYVFCITKGSVFLAEDKADGERTILSIYYAGSIFGEIFCFQNDCCYPYYAAALEDTDLYCIPWEFFYHRCARLCSHHEILEKNLLKIMAEQSLEMINHFKILSGKTLRQKIAKYLLAQPSEQEHIKQSLSREELADYLCVTRPSLSRELMAMKRDGLFDIKGKEFYITNRSVLIQAAND